MGMSMLSAMRVTVGVVMLVRVRRLLSRVEIVNELDTHGLCMKDCEISEDLDDRSAIQTQDQSNTCIQRVQPRRSRASST